MSKITVDKIRLTIGRKAIELTPEELRDLRDVLDTLFPAKYRQGPIIIERPAKRRWPYPSWEFPEVLRASRWEPSTLCLAVNRATR